MRPVLSKSNNVRKCCSRFFEANCRKLATRDFSLRKPGDPRETNKNEKARPNPRRKHHSHNKQIRLLTTVGASLDGGCTIVRPSDYIHKKNAHRLLQAKLGSFDSQAWHEAEITLTFLNRQQTVESVFLALDLLDRSIKENRFQSNRNGQAISLPIVLSTSRLNFTVHNWRLCAKNLETSAQRSVLPNPTNILATIDYFREQYNSEAAISSGPTIPEHLPLQPNTYTYTMIIDALAFAQDHTTTHRIPTRDEGTIQPDCHGNSGWHFNSTPAPVIAEMLLQRLLQECKTYPHLTPSIVTFNTVLNVWARSRQEEAPEKAEELLRRMQKLSEQPGWEGLSPNLVSYGTIMQVFSNSNAKDATERAEMLLEELKKMHSSNDDIYPNSEVYMGVLKAWGRSPDPAAGEHAYQRLQELILAYKEQLKRKEQDGTEKSAAKAKNLLPGSYCFKAVMNIFAERGDTEKTTALLEQLQSLYEATGRNPELCTDAHVFNCVLRAWSQSRSAEASAQSEAILQRMRDLAERTGNSDLYPNIISYNTQLHTLSKSYGVEDAFLRAERIFKTIQESPGIEPNLGTYKVYLHLLARSNRSNRAGQAEATIHQMWDLYWSRNRDFYPDEVCYNTAIDACRNQPERAEGLFREMRKHHKPSRITYGSLVTAWATIGRPDKALNVFNEMLRNGVRPSKIEYNATIHAWAKQGNVDQAERMLNRCLQDYQNGNKEAKPDVKSFSSILNALSKRKSGDPWQTAKRAEAVLMQMEQRSEVLGDGVKPNTYSFNNVLDCFSKCKKNEAAPEHAERILRHMELLADSGNSDVMPSVISYTTVMNCWVKSNAAEAPDRVERLFQDLRSRYESTGDQSLKPSQYTFNAIIGAHARNLRRDESLEKAMGHFNAMIEHYAISRDPDLRPCPMHFSIILSALSKRGMAKEAEAFLDRILEISRDYSASDGKKLEISSSFNGLIGAHAKSRLPGAAARAEEVLRRMQNLGSVSEHVVAPPNVYSYTSVMLAWSLVSDPSKMDLAVEKCENLLHEMLDKARTGDRSVMPNQFTFGTLLQVIARSNLPDKAERAQRVVAMMNEHSIRPDHFVRTTLGLCFA